MREVGVLAIVLIVISSLMAFLYSQDQTQKQVRAQLVEEQKARQLESTENVANHAGSDLTLISSILEGLSSSRYLQEGDFSSDAMKTLANEKYLQMDTLVGNLFILNKHDIVVFNIGNSSNALAPVEGDFSSRPVVKETRSNLQPVFSEAFEIAGKYSVFITSPIIDRETGQYLGLVGASVPTVRFFEHYGNVHDINSQFLVAFDKKGILLAVGASQSLVGRDYFGSVVQQFVNHDPTLNSHTSKMLQGESGHAIYDYGRGERLTTYHPIYVADEPLYFLQVVTPTETISSEIQPILSTENVKLALFLTASVAASSVLVIFLWHWNSSLRKEVAKRTKDLEKSHRFLAESNEQLRQHDNFQKEFINIAAHEMRTPIQPILGMSDMIKEKIEKLNNQQFIQVANQQGSDQRTLTAASTQIASMLDVISRNANRLDKLSNNLLETARIENKSFMLNKEKIDLNKKVYNAVTDVHSIDSKIVLELYPEPLIVQADIIRLFQVISNLLNNAIKFTCKGTIVVRCEKQDEYAVVSIKDTGTGIDPEIMPRLFAKFATKSEKGIGLGLYISKSIIEAHGGKIWAKNNEDGKGATFVFTLPIAKNSD
jgi:signal transduction histidine kinase